MKKLFIIFLLCVIIAATFGYSALKYMSVGEDGNFFNRQYRANVSEYPIVRTILGLHRDGDAKSDFLGSRFNSIQIEVDSMDGYAIPYSVLESFAGKISAITGKPAKLLYSDTNIPYSAQISNGGLENIYSNNKSSSSRQGIASLYVLLASANETESDIMGSTLDESGIIVYLDILSDFIKYNSELFNSYLLSTLLHEFGHQLGLRHNAEPNCLMSELSDQRSTLFESSSEVIQDFCPYELQQITTIKAKS